MSLSDSMFLFEIVVEELKSYIDCKEFYIQSQFADIFTLNLRDPNDFDSVLPKPKTKKPKKKTKMRKKLVKKVSTDGKVQSGQSILFTSRIDTLITCMKNFPIELSFFNRDDPESKLGSTHIPWSPVYIDYLTKLHLKPDISPVYVNGGYNVYDDYTSKRMATIRLNIKLTYLKDKITSSFRSLSEENHDTFMYTGFNSKPTTILSRIKAPPVDLTQETGIIRTIYSGGKRKIKSSSKIKSKKKKSKPPALIEKTEENKQLNPEIIEEKKNLKESCIYQSSKLSFVRSDTEFEKNKQIDIIKTKSCSSINRDQFNILNYVFADLNRPLGNQVYCVGYFTVENEFNKDADSSKGSSGKAPTQSSEKSDKSKAKFKFKICDNECPAKKHDGICSESMCSLDLPEEAADLITVTKCKQVDCDHKKHRVLITPPDDRVLINLDNEECCNKTETVEQVVGGVKAKMKIGEVDCYCSCECTFGFVKKTTFCGVCGGYQFAGEDISTKQPNAPFPCPIYHKLVDKGKLKTWSISGSESRRKGDDGKKKSVIGDGNTESEMDFRKGKKKKDDRFKFNYGYTAAKIGHTHCAMPCTGTLGSVPKSMGWLWTAEDIPGMKEIARGWKPGAISKRLLRMLNKAKSRQSPAQQVKPTKKPKKRVEDKPTLIISKCNGEYTIEMQVEPNEDLNVDCSPLIYKIAPVNQEHRIKSRARKQRRLVRKAVNEVWSDPYHPEICEETCLKAYRQAIGLMPYDRNNPDCTCPGPDEQEDDSRFHSCSCDDAVVDSDCSSMDVDWEIHFSPPTACKQD